ncbi:MAG: hypothetical protein QNK03_17005 [Myxococcota bacterium]|nr:hypothetical protein [Myxococcota bacterium]
MSPPGSDPAAVLWRGLEQGRVHSAYLLSGGGPRPRELALRFARGVACEADGPERPCEACDGCRRSLPREEVALDGTGKKGPLLRHVGEHPDLLWVERGADDTRVRIGQIRAVQQALRLRAHEGGWRAAVIADAEWLNQEAQNALLRLLEEPPPSTTIVLVAATSSGLLATVRSRCQRVPLRAEAEADDETLAARGELTDRIDGIGGLSVPDVLDWAEEFRGARAPAAAATQALLEGAGTWLRDRVADKVRGGDTGVRRELEAFARIQGCRKSLAQRNANPQMVAERALLTLREVARA